MVKVADEIKYLWISIIAILTWIILLSWEPSWVQSNGELDHAKHFWASVVLTLIFTILLCFWLCNPREGLYTFSFKKASNLEAE